VLERFTAVARDAWPWLRAPVWLALGLGLGFLPPALVYLDRTVQAEFSSRQYQFPSRVYARALTLKVGQAARASDIEQSLIAGDYQALPQVAHPGSFSRQANQFVIHTRNFVFADGAQTARVVRLGLNSERVATISDARTGAALEQLRVDPALIASIYSMSAEDRDLKSLEQMPPMIVAAVQAVEDRSFKHHHGVDLLALLRATVANVRAGRLVQGGSTITQQLVKNFFLTRAQTPSRKLNEMAMAVLLERRFSKREILETYLNDVYMGQDGARAVHGLAAASQFYFGRDLDRLSVEHVALLVGLIKGPSYFDPRRFPERALVRRNIVLNSLLETGLISAAAHKTAKAAALGVSARAPRKGNRFPAFMELVRAQLNQSYRAIDLQSQGLRVFTTLDPIQQNAAQTAVTEELAAIEKGDRARQLQGAMVVTDVESGDILALVGDRQPNAIGFNRALRAERPIGSIIKPLIYLLAFSDPARYNLASVLDDGPLALKLGDGQTWRPSNYDGRSHGQVSTLVALTRSYNLATVRLGMSLGVPNVIKLMQGLGLRRNPAPHPSILLGALALTPLEVAQLYQVVAARGNPMPLRAVTKVVARDGRVLQRAPDALTARDRPAANYLLTLAMQEAIQTGTGKNLDAGLKSKLTPAGKTGTSNDQRDSWFVGFTASHLGVAWVGRDDNKPSGVTGASGAMRLWAGTFKRLASTPLRPVQPPSVEFAWLDASSGLLSTPECGNAVYLPFVRDYAPLDYGPCALLSQQEPAPEQDLSAPSDWSVAETDSAEGDEASEQRPKKKRRWRWFWEKD